MPNFFLTNLCVLIVILSLQHSYMINVRLWQWLVRMIGSTSPWGFSGSFCLTIHHRCWEGRCSPVRPRSQPQNHQRTGWLGYPLAISHVTPNSWHRYHWLSASLPSIIIINHSEPVLAITHHFFLRDSRIRKHQRWPPGLTIPWLAATTNHHVIIVHNA